MHAVSGGIGEKSGKSLVFFLIKEFQKRWGKPPSQNMVTGKENGHQKLVTGKKNGHQKLVTRKKNGCQILVTGNISFCHFSSWAALWLLCQVGQDDVQSPLISGQRSVQWPMTIQPLVNGITGWFVRKILRFSFCSQIRFVSDLIFYINDGERLPL